LSNGEEEQAAYVPVVHQRPTFDGNMSIPEWEQGTGFIFRVPVSWNLPTDICVKNVKRGLKVSQGY